jgi:HK97 family phage portal protein
MIFGSKPQQTETTQLKMLNGYMPIFTTLSGEPYDSDEVRAAVDAIARNAAKLKAKHIRKINNEIQPQNSALEKMLQVRPNPYMDAYTFFYKVITNLYMSNNSFIFVDVDKMGMVKGFYPVNYSSVELKERSGVVYIKFSFIGGQQITLPYTELIHLRRFFYKHDFYGESNEVALNPTLELINTTNQGIINAVKSSAFIRGILKFTGMLKDSDIAAARNRFVNEYLSLGNNGGIGAIDSKAEFVPLDSKPTIVDDKQMQLISDKVCKYFGIGPKIITSSYSEDEWNAFYESTIEPIAIQMSLEFTSKLFTSREQGHGNEIIFEANRLQYASNTTKINLIT